MAAKQDLNETIDALDMSEGESPVDEPPSHSSHQHSSNRPGQTNARAEAASKETHDANLRLELANVRKVNQAIEGVLEGLEKAKSNMKTEHNQRLILNPSWQGATQDIADMEEEAVSQRQAAERREAEEQERRTAAARKAEEEEARRRTDVVAVKPKPTTRGRTGIGRGSSATRTGNTSTASTNTSTSSITRGTSNRRTTTGLVRGTRGARGRG